MQNSGSNSFDRFTERARKVLTLAQEEAQRFNHNYIGTEHLLLGLVREGEGVAAKVLSNLGIELTKVRSAVEFIIGRGERQVVGEIGLTPRAKAVIELALDEARRLGHHYIGTEHLLLGLIREGEGIASGVLESLGVSLQRTREQVINVLSQPGSSEPPAGAATAVENPFVRPPVPGLKWAYLALDVVSRDDEPVVERVHPKNETPSGIELGMALRDALNRLGELDWELIGIDPSLREDGGPSIYVFKRLA